MITSGIMSERKEKRLYSSNEARHDCVATANRRVARQDLLYQPVSLSCGHIFCARCALAAAVGHSNLVGNAEQLLFSMACYSTEKPCPCCRSTLYGSRREKRSPFYDITRMHKLEQALQAR